MLTPRLIQTGDSQGLHFRLHRQEDNAARTFCTDLGGTSTTPTATPSFPRWLSASYSCVEPDEPDEPDISGGEKK